ncbi:MAG: hypothetical protein A4E28_01403 [Methanocella sp. PtaU1.Bin125]|nr:MAG: hypothetical protein A4E28_01403 [Methanocella sp. PtaU1.Bin125]
MANTYGYRSPMFTNTDVQRHMDILTVQAGNGGTCVPICN